MVSYSYLYILEVILDTRQTDPACFIGVDGWGVGGWIMFIWCLDGKLVGVTWLCLSGCSCWLLSSWVIDVWCYIVYITIIILYYYTYTIIYYTIIIYYIIILIIIHTYTYLYYTHLLFCPVLPFHSSHSFFPPQSSLIIHFKISYLF
jgi:hypothetical protein